MNEQVSTTSPDGLGKIIHSFPIIGPRLSWLNGKTRPQGDGGRKGFSGHLTEHTEALAENGSRTFAKEVDKILNPPPAPQPEVNEAQL